MKTERLYAARVLLLALLALLALVLLTPQTTTAQGPEGDRHSQALDQNAGQIMPEAIANMPRYLSVVQKGGYVAKGVGLRSTGSGTIVIAGIPAGATVTHAFLFWNVFHAVKATADAQGAINGHAIVGTLVGSDIADYYYVPGDMTWSYRASVKPFMLPGGNGTYSVSGFPVGLSGDPRIMGATLVVLFSKSNYPLTTIQIYNGAAPSPCCTGRVLRLQVTNIVATAPAGMASTTFIGADGASGSGGVSTFNTTVLPTVTWQGAEGYYWDTMNVDVHALIDPPENGFWLSTKVPNGVIWVAQVISYSSGSQDSDGDGLKDGWELNGYTNSATGAFVNLPAMGANLLHKDLFVEADYMVDAAGNHLPSVNALNDIVWTFDNAPVSNPDGATGVHIHIDTGGAAAGAAAGTYAAYNLGGGNNVGYQQHLGADTLNCSSYDWGQFDAKKNANFNPARINVFHYMIFAHDLAPCMGSTSGISRNGSTDALFIKGATNFVVAMGSWSNEGYDYAREGTFVHELGHNLGLRHGGNDHQNYKPNYLSVMNYLYQTSAVWRDFGYNYWNQSYYGYSSDVVPTLNEAAMSEPNGLGPTTLHYGLAWICPSGSITWHFPASSNVNWDCDGDTSHTVSADVNRNGAKGVLGNQNNWASITFAGGGVIGAGMTMTQSSAQMPVTTRWTNELTFESALKLQNREPPAHR
ncbi:MAG: hypothetical protein WCF84_22815 [Anaerolineae bacterium]